MQRYTMFFIVIGAVHVSSGFSAHHQELKNCICSIGTCKTCVLLPLAWLSRNYAVICFLICTINDYSLFLCNVDNLRKNRCALWKSRVKIKQVLESCRASWNCITLFQSCSLCFGLKTSDSFGARRTFLWNPTDCKADRGIMGVGKKLFNFSISWKYLWRSNRSISDRDRVE
jgi:hypothetical protein